MIEFPPVFQMLPTMISDEDSELINYKWYYLDECTQVSAPYDTKELAEKALALYCKFTLGN